MKKRAIAKTTLEDLLATRPARCERCGRTEMLTLDHIIPQQLLLLLGLSIEEMYEHDNLAIMCRPCNQFKSFRIDFSDPRAKKILLKYLERL